MLLHQELSERIIAALFRVHRTLGPGLLEQVYEKALLIEFQHLGIPCAQQVEYKVMYRKQCAGSYFADLVVDESIILELKSVGRLNEVMEAQLLNYLGISGLRVGYLVNFHGKILEKKRMVR